ncbi:hypothetical protein ALO82_200324 [Pseudomonas syringae pv. broussonetiae]|nr:hypothetical protein ALO82_200324 [Pseudomonas syringae pv. broussonetiae]KWT09441.1 hypothetical protein AL047_16355 [Pseudomonas syringae pv. broussonetiae]
MDTTTNQNFAPLATKLIKEGGKIDVREIDKQELKSKTLGILITLGLCIFLIAAFYAADFLHRVIIHNLIEDNFKGISIGNIDASWNVANDFLYISVICTCTILVSAKLLILYYKATRYSEIYHKLPAQITLLSIAITLNAITLRAYFGWSNEMITKYGIEPIAYVSFILMIYSAITYFFLITTFFKTINLMINKAFCK